MDETLKRRLAGASILLLAAFVVVSLLPEPAVPPAEDGVEVVTIPLSEADAVAPAPPSADSLPPVLAAPAVSDGDGTATQDVDSTGDEDVAIEIAETPPPATPAAKPSPLAATAKPPAPVAAKPSPPAATTKPPAPVAAKPSLPPAAAPSATPSAPSPKLPATVVVKPATASPDKPVVASPAAGKPNGAWFVQVGGFADIGNARQAQARVQALGQASLISPLETSQGTLYRVRAGPYANREQAAPALARLTANGFAGAKIVGP